MTPRAGALLVFLLFGAAVCAFGAAVPCYEYYLTQAPPRPELVGSSASAVASQWAAANKNDPTGSTGGYEWSVESCGPPSGSVTCTLGKQNKPPTDPYPVGGQTWCGANPTLCQYQAGATTLTISRREVTCSGTCAQSDGTKMTLSGVGASAPAESCQSGCKVVSYGVSVALGGNWAGSYKVEGSCSEGPTGTPPAGAAPSCITGASGLQYCKNTAGSGQCGYVNDQFVCLASTPPNGCQALPDGSKVCGTNASTPPAPNNGTPGEKAAADETINSQSGVGGTVTNIYSYYGSATVAGSSGGSSTPTREPGDGDTGSGDGSQDGAGECADGACEGSLPNGGDLEELDSFGTMTQGFIDRIAAAPLVASVANLGSSLPAGACPDWTLTMFDREISLSAPMCTIWGEIAGILSAVMLVAWGLLAARIVLSA